MPHIDYHFTTVSPWSYLGHTLFLDIARRHGATVSVHPTPFGSVFAESGGLPLPKRHPLRQRYRLSELQHWRVRRDLPLTLHPRFFPADATLADCTALAAAREGLDPLSFIGAALRACWAEERDVADPDTVAELAGANGLSVTLSRETDVKAMGRTERVRNSQECCGNMQDLDYVMVLRSEAADPRPCGASNSFPCFHHP